MAREVFLEQGVLATTAEVASRAGVSEGTVFHRFRSKGALFREAMQFDPDELPKLMRGVAEGLDELDVREALIRIAHGLIEVGRVAMPLMMMSWSNPDNGCIETEFSEEEQRHGYREVLRQFAGYFEQKMNEGKLRRVDAEIFTRALLGAVHHYCMTQLVVQHTGEFALPEGMFVRGLVDLLLTGVAPSTNVPAPTASARRLPRG